MSAGAVVIAVPMLVMVIPLGLEWVEARLPTRTAVMRRDPALEEQSAREPAQSVLERGAAP